MNISGFAGWISLRVRLVKTYSGVIKMVIARNRGETHKVLCQVYKSDYEYLKENRIPIARAVRTALAEYVLTCRKNPPILRRDQRDAYILRGVLPDGSQVPEVVVTAKLIEISAKPPVLNQSACSSVILPDMQTWTKEERDTWILTGTIPVHLSECYGKTISSSISG
jgi:hypothetical protein